LNEWNSLNGWNEKLLFVQTVQKVQAVQRR
jgi:hypothetical protein